MSFLVDPGEYERCPGTLERITEQRKPGYGGGGKGLCKDCGFEVPLWFAHRPPYKLKAHHRKVRERSQ